MGRRDLEKHVIPHIIQLVLSLDGLRICSATGTPPSYTLAPALLPADSSESKEAVLLDSFWTLAPRIHSPHRIKEPKVFRGVRLGHVLGD